MPAGEIIGGLMGEIKAHPWTTVVAGVAFFGLGGFAIWAGPKVALAGEDTRQVKSQVAEIQKQILTMGLLQQKRTMEDRIRQIDGEIFSIQNKIDELQKNTRFVDGIYMERLRDLRGDRNRADRNLNALINANPWLANDTG